MNPFNNASIAIAKEKAVKEQTQNKSKSDQLLPSLPVGLQSILMSIVINCTFSDCSIAISGQQAACQPTNTKTINVTVSAKTILNGTFSIMRKTDLKY